MKTATFLCTVVNGKLKIYDRAGFDAIVAAYGDGEDLQLHVEEVGRRRTQKQNRFFHGPVLKAFMDTGLHKQEAKDMLCLMFIPRDVHLLDGTIARVPGHTSELKVDEFNDFIDACIQLAAENDLYIEDADEWRKNRARSAA